MALREREITDKEVWLKWREPNINASEAGALLGIDKYKSPLQLYYQKKGVFGFDEDDSEPIRRGRWLEPAVLKATAEMRPDLLIEPSTSYFDDPIIRIGCTPDAVATCRKTGKKGVVQAKTVGEHVWKSWCNDAGNPEHPLAYELQTMVEGVQTTHADFGILSIMVVGYRVDLHPMPVEVHLGAWDAFVKRTRAFWRDFAKGVAPPVSDIDGDVLKKIFPKGDSTLPPLDLRQDKELPLLIARYEVLSETLSQDRKAIKPIDEEREAIKVKIRGLMGDSEMALLPGGMKATLKYQFRKASESRVLRVSEIKG
jgi:predicted phage-related endonuclease